MVQLSVQALDAFLVAGVAPEDLAEATWGVRTWRGDACGCTDDRCIGHHHESSSYCGCRDVVIQEYTQSMEAAAEASELWVRHVEANDDETRAAVRSALDDWVNRYHRGSPTWSLDEVVDGRQGISITSRYNDLRHLVWAAPTPN